MQLEIERVSGTSRAIWVGIVLAILGALDSAYLAWIKLGDRVALCGGIGDCESVNNSRYAEIGGVPIALLGLIGYLGILLLLLLEVRRPDWQDVLSLMIFGATLAGTLYSGYLTYIELAILSAVCPYCVVSALIMAALLIIALLQLRSGLRWEQEG